MASVRRSYQQSIRPSGCAGGPCLLPVSVLGQQKARPGTYQTAKNRLHSAATWAKITIRRIIRAGHEVRQHPMTLCRRERPPTQQENLRHAHYTDSPGVLQGTFSIWVCVLLGCAGNFHTCTAFLFAPQKPAGAGVFPPPGPFCRAASAHEPDFFRKERNMV